MKSTWPPPQVILVGLEPNQHGHAASQEQAASSCPVIFHGVLSLGSFAALVVEAKQENAAASMPNNERKSGVVFMVQNLQLRALRAIRFCDSRGLPASLGRFGRSGFAEATPDAAAFALRFAPSEGWSG